MKVLVLCFLLTIGSCSTNNQDKKLLLKQQDLINYFKNVFNGNISTKNEIVIIINNETCSSCRREIMHDLIEKINRQPLHKSFILMKNDEDILGKISEDPDNSIYIDKNIDAKKYGLNYSSDFIYLFRDDVLYKQIEISNSSVNALPFSII